MEQHSEINRHMTENQWTPEEKGVAKSFNLAIRRGELAEMEEFFAKNPWLKTDRNALGKSWFRAAVTFNQIESIKKLIGWGFDVNVSDEGGSAPLRMAVLKGNEDVARLLLENGANPDSDRAILTALNHSDPQERLNFLAILVEAGANANQFFTMFGDEDAKFRRDIKGSGRDIKGSGAFSAKTRQIRSRFRLTFRNHCFRVEVTDRKSVISAAGKSQLGANRSSNSSLTNGRADRPLEFVLSGPRPSAWAMQKGQAFGPLSYRRPPCLVLVRGVLPSSASTRREKTAGVVNPFSLRFVTRFRGSI